MRWVSWENFFAMGGYALYVWGSVAMSFGLLAWELFALRRRRLAALKRAAQLDTARASRKGEG